MRRQACSIRKRAAGNSAKRKAATVIAATAFLYFAASAVGRLSQKQNTPGWNARGES
jgi:hypothetical protein